MDIIGTILFGGGAGAVVSFALKNWFLERLRLEYARKLEDHKHELDSKVALLSYDLQTRQQKRMLFFEHQRLAFAELLTCIAKIPDSLRDILYSIESGSDDTLSFEALDRLWAKFYEHHLFLDNSCIAAVELLLKLLYELVRGEAGNFEIVTYRDIHPNTIFQALDLLSFLHPRIAELFQQRLEVISGSNSEREIALLGAIMMLNMHRFNMVVVVGDIKVDLYDESPAQMVSKAEDNFTSLIQKLNELRQYILSLGIGSLHFVVTSIERYLNILQPEAKQIPK